MLKTKFDEMRDLIMLRAEPNLAPGNEYNPYRPVGGDTKSRPCNVSDEWRAKERIRMKSIHIELSSQLGIEIKPQQFRY